MRRSQGASGRPGAWLDGGTAQTAGEPSRRPLLCPAAAAGTVPPGNRNEHPSSGPMTRYAPRSSQDLFDKVTRTAGQLGAGFDAGAIGPPGRPPTTVVGRAGRNARLAATSLVAWSAPPQTLIHDASGRHETKTFASTWLADQVPRYCAFTPRYATHCIEHLAGLARKPPVPLPWPTHLPTRAAPPSGRQEPPSVDPRGHVSGNLRTTRRQRCQNRLCDLGLHPLLAIARPARGSA